MGAQASQASPQPPSLLGSQHRAQKSFKTRTSLKLSPYQLHNPVVALAEQMQERNSQNTNQEPQLPQPEHSAPSARGDQLGCTSHHCPGRAWGILLPACHCWSSLRANKGSGIKRGFGAAREPYYNVMSFSIIMSFSIFGVLQFLG